MTAADHVPQPDALGQIAALLRDLAGRVERTALLMDLAAHGRARAGEDVEGLAAAELRPIEERARALHLELVAAFPADVERALGLLRASGSPEATPPKPPRRKRDLEAERARRKAKTSPASAQPEPAAEPETQPALAVVEPVAEPAQAPAQPTVTAAAKPRPFRQDRR